MAFAKGLSFFALHPKARGGEGRWEAGVQSSPAPAQGSQCHPSPRERVRGASLVRAATSSPVWSAVCLERKASAPVSSCGDLTKRFHRVIWRILLVRTCVTVARTRVGAAYESHPASEKNPHLTVCGDRLYFMVTGLSEVGASPPGSSMENFFLITNHSPFIDSICCNLGAVQRVATLQLLFF